MKHTGKIIKRVLPGSIAEEGGIEPGDKLLTINGNKIRDLFDYRYLMTDENLVLEIRKKDGEVWEVEVEKDEYEDLGLEFEAGMMDEARGCNNRCIFCFIDQLPRGMRSTLYFRDDDVRLSFLHGNYVTLTNIGCEDMDRLIRYRLSPVNVSVHATNPVLRAYMLRNRHAGDVLNKIKTLVDGGITVNCQVVLCRGINDGEELDRTLDDLSSMYPGVKSISVVPVGLTKYREGLTRLEPYDGEASGAVISQVEKKQQQWLEEKGSRIVYLADEFYIMAGRAIPPYEAYEDFPQLENGVGMVAMFRHDFEKCLERLPFQTRPGRAVSVATGVSAERFIREMTQRLEERVNGLKVGVYAINNVFFGENVTVAGLLTGRDIAAQLSGRMLGEELFIPGKMLKAGDPVFLDDFTVEMLEEQLGVKVTVVADNGCDFVEKITGAEGAFRNG